MTNSRPGAGVTVMPLLGVTYPFHCLSTLLAPCFSQFYTFLLSLRKVAILHVQTSQNSAEVTARMRE